MSLLILPNSAWQYAAQIKPTDTSNVNTTDTVGIENVVGGHRHHFWQTSTADRRLVYVDLSARMNATHCIVAGATDFANHSFKVLSWSDYSATMTTEYDSGAAFAGPYVGKQSSDFIYEFAARRTAREGFGIELAAGTGGGWIKTVNKMYFADAFTINFGSIVRFTPSRFPERYTYRKQTYLIEERWSLVADNLTAAEKASFEGIYNLHDEPVFIYDSSGDIIPYKLLHGMISNYIVTALFNDMYRIDFEVLAIRNK